MVRKEAPDAAYLVRLKAELQSQYEQSGEQEQIKRGRRVREMVQPSGLGADLRLTDLPDIGDSAVAKKVFDTTAKLSLHFPTVAVTPLDKDVAKHQENATDRERWTEKVLFHAGRQKHGMHTFSAMCD